MLPKEKSYDRWDKILALRFAPVLLAGIISLSHLVLGVFTCFSTYVFCSLGSFRVRGYTPKCAGIGEAKWVYIGMEMATSVLWFLSFFSFICSGISALGMV